MHEEFSTSLFDKTSLDPGRRLRAVESAQSPARDVQRMVEQVRDGSPKGLQDLHDMIRQLAERHFCGRFGGLVHYDYVHDLYLVVVEAIREGALGDFRQLDGFVRTVVRYQALVEFQRRSPAERGAGLLRERKRA